MEKKKEKNKKYKNEIEKLRKISTVLKRELRSWLDVFEQEPIIPEAFLTMDNVVLTPHIGKQNISIISL